MAFADPVDGVLSLVAINDTGKEEVFTFTVKDITGLPADTDLTAVPTLLSGEVIAPPDGTAAAATLPTSGEDHRFLLIEWRDSAGEHRSHFISEPEHMDSAVYMQALALCGFDDWQGFTS
jgi:hypothetical protein